ncbi:MAG TPA: ferredoxin-thioredoxin reductase catalytic domain-containing protein [Methanomicrobiales archaeon]|nr:ferredoxin-thioredoxin reductase catalytic domain-containing protein [Methanomicrobiales archaeon]
MAGKQGTGMTKEEKDLYREILSWAREYAKEKGLALNTDDRQFTAVIRGLVRNRLRHGERYCPCRIRSGDPEKDRLIICPCVHHGKEIESEGHCHCNLFFRQR